MEKTERNKVAFDVNLKGVRLAVFQNESEARRWYSAVPSRRYKDSATGETKYTTSFSAGDLILLRESITQVLTWMSTHQEMNEEE